MKFHGYIGPRGSGKTTNMIFEAAKKSAFGQKIIFIESNKERAKWKEEKTKKLFSEFITRDIHFKCKSDRCLRSKQKYDAVMIDDVEFIDIDISILSSLLKDKGELHASGSYGSSTLFKTKEDVKKFIREKLEIDILQMADNI